MFNRSYLFEVDYLYTHFDHIHLSPEDTVSRSIVCPACEEDMIPFTRTSNLRGNPVLEKSMCPSCGYMHFTRMPCSAWFDDFYANRWEASRDVPKHLVHDSYPRNLELLRKYDIPRNAKIFDYGAGYGQFLTACKLNGYNNLHGVEASKRRAKYCRSQLGFDVSHATSRAVKHKDVSLSAPYDLVHSHNVFEHVNNIGECLDDAAALLKPEGIFMLHIPYYKVDPFIEIGHALVHLRQFTVPSVIALMHKHDFEIIELDECNGHISVVAQKGKIADATRPPRIAEIDLISKLDRDFAVAWNTSATGVRTCFDLKPKGGSNPVTSLDSEWLHSANFQWTVKRLMLGTDNPNLAIRGPRGSFINLLNLKNLSAKVLRRVLNFGNLEISGRITERACRLEGAPLLDFRYNSGTAVALIK